MPDCLTPPKGAPAWLEPTLRLRGSYFTDDRTPLASAPLNVVAGNAPTVTILSPTDGLTFKATHPKTKEALEWMGFEARQAILDGKKDVSVLLNEKVGEIKATITEKDGKITPLLAESWERDGNAWRFKLRVRR